MKLFGGGKKKQRNAVRGDSLPEIEEFRPIPGNLDRVQTVVIRPGGKKKKGFKKILCTFGVLAAIALAAVIGYTIWEEAPDINDEGPVSLTEKDEAPVKETEIPMINLPVAEPQPGEETSEEPEPTENMSEQAYQEMPENIRNQDCYTFVLAAYDQIGASTDTILVGRLDTKEGTLNVVSIPRDTLVNVDWALKKINTVMVYEESEPERFVNQLNSILGFSVDCYAFVDIRAVEKMVDAIGGVYYTVPRAMEYDDPTQDLHIHIPSGYQWLDGERAVQVLRYRVGNGNTGYPNGDLGRINTQHDFLLSIASQMLKLGNIPNLDALIKIFEEHVETDLDVNNLAFFIREFLKLDAENVRFATLPGEGIGIRGGSYYEIDLIAWVEMINEYLNPFSLEIGVHNLDVLSYDSSDGSVMSTTGEIVPYESFYDFSTYTG